MFASSLLRQVILLLTCCTMATACVTTAKPATNAVKHFDPDYCLQAASESRPQDETRCPGFMSGGVKDAMSQCKEVGGKLIAANRSTVYSVDVNGDRRPEYLYEFNANFGCEGAAAFFSCGSADCPWTLYMQADGTWQDIGLFFEGTQIELQQRNGETPFRDLLVTCDQTDSCDTALFRWDGSRYVPTVRILRGYSIQLPLLGNLWSPTRPISVLAEARDDSPSLGDYDQNALFVILGAASGTDYICVSPCRACATGFIHKSDIPPALLR